MKLTEQTLNNAVANTSELLCGSEHLDVKAIENRIQQCIGIVTLLDNVGVKGECRARIIYTIKALYQKKREHLYGYVDPAQKELLANYGGL